MFEFFRSKKKSFEGCYWNKEQKLVPFVVESKDLDRALMELKKRKDFWAICGIAERL